MAIAGDIINDCIIKTKSRFFPISKEWFKLGFISWLSIFNSAGNNLSQLNNLSDFPGIKQFIAKNLTAILSLAGIAFVFGFFWRIVSFTFGFIFIDSIISKKTYIVEGFNRHIKKGFSLFLFTTILGICNLLILGLVALPILIPLLNNFDNLSWDLVNIPYLIFMIAFFVIDLLVISLLMWVITNLSIYDMYKKDNNTLVSISRSFRLVQADFVEVLLFFLLKFALGIAVAIVLGIGIIILLIPFVIIGAIFVFIGFFLASLGISNIILIILGIFIGIILLSIFDYVANVVFSPIQGFFVYYNYTFVEKLESKNNM